MSRGGKLDFFFSMVVCRNKPARRACLMVIGSRDRMDWWSWLPCTAWLTCIAVRYHESATPGWLIAS